MDARTGNQMQMLTFASSPTIVFRCECSDPSCTETVPLGPNAYHDIRVAGESVLSPGHAAVEDAPLAAEREWVSREEAQVRLTAAALKIV